MKYIFDYKITVGINHLFQKKKTVLILLLLFSGMVFATKSYSQTSKVTVVSDNITIGKIINEIEKQTDYLFVYNVNEINLSREVKVNVRNESVKDVLTKVFEGFNVYFAMEGKNIMLMTKSKGNASPEQKKKITGIVTDSNGEAVIGASIAIKGTSTGTITDVDGKFSIESPAGSTLLVSYVGYAPKEIKIGENTNLQIVIQEDQKLLDEVVVVGYGTQRRSLVTSAISAYKPNENTRPVINPGDMLDGTVPGVTITKTSGNLGAGLSFNVRGASSISAGNEPLIVVDGIPLTSYDAAITSFGESLSSLSTISTFDIESIEVLKDAASAAIYGSRATNGVVLITTKSGKAGKAKFDINVNMGISEFANRNGIKMADSKLYLEVVNEGIDNYNRQMNLKPEDVGYVLQRSNPFGNLPDADWLGLITRSAFSYNVDAALSGGNDKTTYYIGGSYLNQEGVVITNYLNKMSLKTNVKHRLNKYFELGAYNNIVYTKNDRIPGASLGTSLIGRTITQRPFDRPYKPNGDYYVGGTADLTYHNIVQVLNEQTTYVENLRYLGTLSSTINFMKNLSLKTSFSTDVAYTDDYIYYNENHPYGANMGVMMEGVRIYKSYLMENFANYNIGIGDGYTLDLMAGHSFQHTGYKRTGVEVQGFPSPSFTASGVAAEITSAGSSITAYAMESYFGRTNLSYKDRYIATLTFRADGSSKFSRPNRFGYFPSVSFGWNASNESFWGLDKTNLKLRASYGRTGNQEGIGQYASQALISGGRNYGEKSGIALSAAGNKDLKWESADQYNAGFDLALFNGKINMIADIYLKNTWDLLYAKPVPTTSGWSSVISNVGAMQNKGIEFAINGHFNIEKVEWTSAFNIAYNRNKLTKLRDDEEIIAYDSDIRALKVGEEFGTWYLYHPIGIYQYDEEVPEGLYKQGVRAGDIKYYGAEDGVIDSSDKLFFGSSNPKIFGGWSNTFTYQGFELNFQFSYKFGHKIYSGALQQSERIGGDWGLTEVAALGRWTGPGTSNFYPRAYNSFTHNFKSYSSMYLVDGSYVRLRAVTLGYRLPKQTISKAGLNSLRVYVQGDNLLLFTSKEYRGFDPEVMNNTDSGHQGYDNYITPPPRTVTFGINASF